MPISKPVLVRLLASLLIISTLTACIFDKDTGNASTTNQSALPDINPSLSSESPIGIWMLEISSTVEESFYFNDLEDTANNIEKTYRIQRFLIITEDPEQNDSYLINDCSEQGPPSLLKQWALQNSELTIPSLINQPPEIVGYYLMDQTIKGSLQLFENRSLQGQEYSQITFSVHQPSVDILFETADPEINPNFSFAAMESLASILFPKKYLNTKDVRGVKISDEINFASAPELDVQIEASAMSNNPSALSSPIKCLSLSTQSSTSYFASKENVRTKPITSNSTSVIFSNDDSLLIKAESSYDADQKNITTDSLTFNFKDVLNHFYSTDCPEDSPPQCEALVSYESQSDSSRGNVSTSVNYLSDQSNEQYIDVKINIK